jgi:hypothetical protein
MFDRIVTNQFTDAENTEIARRCVDDFGTYRVKQFMQGSPDEHDREEDGA